MAKKDKIKVDISVSGVSVEDLIKGKYNFENVSDKSIKQMTSRLVSAMNKRIVRLGKSEIGKLSPTYKRFEKKGKYSVKGLSRSQTIGLFNQLRESMAKKTSLSAFKEYRQDLYNKLNLTFENKTFEEAYEKEIKQGILDETTLEQLRKEYKNDEQKFWELYAKYQEIDKENENWRGQSSKEVIQAFFNQGNWEEMSMQEKINRINELYEEQQRRQALINQGLESGYFESEDDFYGFGDDDEDEIY